MIVFNKYDDAANWTAYNVCHCGSDLSIAWGGAYGYNGYVILCPKSRTHEATKKRPLREVERLKHMKAYADPDEIDEQIQQIQLNNLRGGKLKNNYALQHYQTRDITPQLAKDMVETLWKDAPEIEKYKAIMVCSQFKLNPVMGHVNLVPYKRKDSTGKWTGEYDWTLIMSIKANRIIANTGGPISYEDGPRMMTEEEEKIYNGFVDKDAYHAIVQLSGYDKQSKREIKAKGIGRCSKQENVKGLDKGNTRQNQARIRAERNALGKLYPEKVGDVSNYEVIEEDYIEADYEDVTIPQTETPPPIAETSPPQSETTESPIETEPPAQRTGHGTMLPYEISGREKGWKLIRELQKKYFFDDAVIKKAFRDEIKKQGKDIKVSRAGLSESVPEWAIYEIIEQVKKRLEDYDVKVEAMKPPENPPAASKEETPEPSTQEATQSKEETPDTNEENPFDTMMSGKDIDELEF